VNLEAYIFLQALYG